MEVGGPRPKSTPVFRTQRSTPSAQICTSCDSARASPRKGVAVTPRLLTVDLPERQRGGQETSLYYSLAHHWNLKGLHWILCEHGQMPSSAVQGGNSRSGEPLYIARARTPDMAQCIGTFLPSTGRCHIRWRGHELRTDQYEVLCYKSKLQTIRSPKSTVSCSIPLLTGVLKVQSLRSPLRVSGRRNFRCMFGIE